ncbi:mediator of RNA polymerase II transcription subunit 8-like isoform X2 [Diospyros lotus]|uniref:mediator of RNA polymerase II transcription subunit 8-like isoform X2 n=1 Tax=Diospyros lotus TaxID=55363 RepID=UPI00225C1BDB|nr:mediator of RNA polymerase II transcription subunit 8-like isoform X2 [Diospyros lotus]
MEGSSSQGGQASQSQPVELLNPAVQQQLNLQPLKTRTLGLQKAIERIIEDIYANVITNSVPKWQDILNQYSMVNLELFNIMEEVNKVSKAFVVYPTNVNAENAAILPVMLSSKLLPEMEVDDIVKKEQVLMGMDHLPVSEQLEKLKKRMDNIREVCESAEKIIAEGRKALLAPQEPAITPTLDKDHAAKINEQEMLLRNAVNHGGGLQIPEDQRQIASALPKHLVDILSVADEAHTLPDAFGSMLQASGAQEIGSPVDSPSGATAATSFDDTMSQLPNAYSPMSGTNMTSTPSSEQQSQQPQHLQQLQQEHQHQQKRQKLMQLPQHQQQLLAHQQFWQSSLPVLGQNQLGRLHDLHGQAEQKFQLDRLLSPGPVQSQMNQGNQLNPYFSQFSSPANSAVFNAAQRTANTEMISNLSAITASQLLLPRMQFGLSSGNWPHASEILSDKVFNMGAVNPGGMMPIQQQQQQSTSQGAFGNLMSHNAQQDVLPPLPRFQRQSNQQTNIGMAAHQNALPALPRFQRQPNQQSGTTMAAHQNAQPPLPRFRRQLNQQLGTSMATHQNAPPPFPRFQ